MTVYYSVLMPVAEVLSAISQIGLLTRVIKWQASFSGLHVLGSHIHFELRWITSRLTVTPVLR